MSGVAPEVRVHPQLGAAVRWPGQEHWWVMLGNGQTPQRMSDVAVRGAAWRELGVGDPEDREDG